MQKPNQSLQSASCKQPTLPRGENKWKKIPILEADGIRAVPSAVGVSIVNLAKDRPQILAEIQKMLQEAKAEEIFFLSFEDSRWNAFTSKSMNIFLSTPLLKEANDGQLLAVIAHEIGHIGLGDKNDDENLEILLSFKRLENAIRRCWRGNISQKACGMIEFASCFFDLLKRLHAKKIKIRKEEYQADRFAVMMGYGKELLEVLEKFWENARLAEKIVNLLSLSAHPSLLKRIAKVKRLMKEQDRLLD
ncbi:MAG: M48 family metalloprotease [Candidatus Anstonellaceae archaeon]